MPRASLLVLLALFAAAPVRAQWEPVTGVPSVELFSVWANGDTIAAGADSIAYVSTNGGATWTPSAPIAAGVTSVEAVRMRNGRLYAGTYGQGVFTSDDVGATWQAYSQGLVGGIANAQLYVKDLLFRGDSLYAATAGAGVYVRRMSGGTWSRYGEAFEPNSASNMNDIAAGGARLFACSGFNGTVFFRDPGASEWTVSFLNNTGFQAGLGAMSAAWTGSAWVVGANNGVYRGVPGQAPWVFSTLGLGTLFTISFVESGRSLIACFGGGGGSTIAYTNDDGETWPLLEELPATFTFEMVRAGASLYAARFDGLWRRSLANLAVPAAPARLRFSLAGAQPVRDVVRFRIELPAAGHATLELFDVAGRRAASVIDAGGPAGPRELVLDARALLPGVYHARLHAAGEGAAGEMKIIRFVRVR